jgi:hypothetical protein
MSRPGSARVPVLKSKQLQSTHRRPRPPKPLLPSPSTQSITSTQPRPATSQPRLKSTSPDRAMTSQGRRRNSPGSPKEAIERRGDSPPFHPPTEPPSLPESSEIRERPWEEEVVSPNSSPLLRSGRGSPVLSHEAERLAYMRRCVSLDRTRHAK